MVNKSSSSNGYQKNGPSKERSTRMQSASKPVSNADTAGYDPMTLYLEDISHISLRRREKEIALARKIETG